MAEHPDEDSDATPESSSGGPTEEDLEYEREERLGIQGHYDSVDLTFPLPDVDGPDKDNPTDLNERGA